MSDSVDRVFVHALNTVKRIPRIGSARPPPSDRLKLYGLYKQSMEGDVLGVMKRPEGQSMEEMAEQEKWDAWSAQHGCSRTEAKRRYVSTLIETMHKYASTTPEARELVAELEFVWDQIKSQSASSITSSSLNQQQQGPSLSSSRLAPHFSQARHPQQRPHPSYASIGPGRVREDPSGDGGEMRILRPVSDGDGHSLVDESPHSGVARRRRSFDSHSADENDLPVPAGADPLGSSDYDVRNRKWRERIERTLVQMTTEIGALREQLEFHGVPTRTLSLNRARGLWVWVVSVTVAAVRHLLIDAVVLGLLALWVGKRDERAGRAVAILSRILRQKVRRVGWKGGGEERA